MPCNPTGGPGGLKIKAAGNAINIEQFACEIEMRHDSAFHGLEIDFAQPNAAASNEFISVQRFAVHCQFGRVELANQLVAPGAWKPGPYRVRSDAGVGHQLFPKPRWDAFNRKVSQPPVRMKFAACVELRSQI